MTARAQALGLMLEEEEGGEGEEKISGANFLQPARWLHRKRAHRNNLCRMWGGNFCVGAGAGVFVGVCGIELWQRSRDISTGSSRNGRRQRKANDYCCSYHD